MQSGPPEEKSTRSRKKVVHKSLEHKKRSRFRENLPKTAALFLHFIAVAAYSIGSVGITAR